MLAIVKNVNKNVNNISFSSHIYWSKLNTNTKLLDFVSGGASPNFVIINLSFSRSLNHIMIDLQKKTDW